ncbi:enoyl-CoA hydratase [Microbacterium sp. RD1]|uniref:enoyl-CoA hydratase n=1 Tax=Microbacterium sp. RD1 TaxID=3457313 RepID=UPI003FA5DD51
MSEQGPLVRREDPAPHVARIVLARPEKRNAQSPQLLYALDAEFVRASSDAEVRVILLEADGPDFSAGHDLGAGFEVPDEPVATTGGHRMAGLVESHYGFECEAYYGLSRRWRDIPTPTIAVAQGRAIAAGLMLLWPMDIIIATAEATFSDPVAAFGVNGVEYFSHVWELGHRRAKEILYTGDAISAAEAQRSGMVNHVLPTHEAAREFALDMAQRITLRSPFGNRLAKESVNRSLDAQGQSVAMQSALALHNLGHAATAVRTGGLIDLEGVVAVRRSGGHVSA